MTEAEGFAGSLWSSITPEGQRLEAAAGERRFDVIIVGGGLLGLSTALALAEGGASVALIERDEPGFGASGRNTGFVVPALKGSIGPDEVARLVPKDKARALIDLIGTAGDAVFGLIRRLDLDCAPEQNGCLQPAPTAAAFVAMQNQVLAMRQAGITWSILGADETYARTGMPGYFGAMHLPTGGQINPLAYVRGLARAVLKAGGAVLRGTVTVLARENAMWRVRTSEGATLLAPCAVLATNALTGSLAPDIARSVIPMRAYQVATQPLEHEIRRKILPHRQPSVDLRNHPLALRWSPDNRLVTGGGALWHGADSVARMARFFLARLRRAIPDLPALQPAFAWSGWIAGTSDFMPRLWISGDGMFAPLGCNGRGVALTTVLLLDHDDTRLPLPLTAPQPWRFHAAMKAAPSFWLAQGRLRDWQNDRALIRR
jgi:glycine/D-amino acid oxidase-like deaminating enzyme